MLPGSFIKEHFLSKHCCLKSFLETIQLLEHGWVTAANKASFGKVNVRVWLQWGRCCLWDLSRKRSLIMEDVNHFKKKIKSNLNLSLNTEIIIGIRVSKNSIVFLKLLTSVSMNAYVAKSEYNQNTSILLQAQRRSAACLHSLEYKTFEHMVVSKCLDQLADSARNVSSCYHY